MKRYNKNIVLILILIGIFVLTGCSNVRLKVLKDANESIIDTENKEDTTNIDSSEDLKATDDSINMVNDDIEDIPVPSTMQPSKNIEVHIYIVNSNAELDLVTALVPADNELTPKMLVDIVVDSMADQSLFIGVEDVSTQDDIVIVSFYSDKAPLTNVGSGLETAILDALAQSLTENLEDYNKIIYRVEGEAYVSGHIELDFDEIYFED